MLSAGQVVYFSGSVTNVTTYFTVATVVNSTDIDVTPAPMTEGPLSSAMDVFDPDGIVVYSGNFKIDSGQSHNFDTAPVSMTQLPFYSDSNDAKGYSDTPGTFLLGHQISVDQFIVRIERVDEFKTAAQTANVTLSRQLYSTVPVDSTGGAFAVTLFTGQENDIVNVVDVTGQCLANNVTISAAGGQLINGLASYVLSANFQSIRLKLVSGNWFSI
jgi:hypothetical protein